MILLKANQDLKNVFSRLIKTMGANVSWTGNFVALDHFLILPGSVRSLVFNFEGRKVNTNILELPDDEDKMEPVADNETLSNVLNMTLYAFGKWGLIHGLKVDKDYSQLSSLFTAILKDMRITPSFRDDNFRFYKDDVQITYEEVVAAAITEGKRKAGEIREEGEKEEERGGLGLWHKMRWIRESASFSKTELEEGERDTNRIGKNFYLTGYLCPGCKGKMHMCVYPQGQEFPVETEEGRVYLARSYTCEGCCLFYTPRPRKLLREGDAYVLRFGDDRDAYEDYLELLGRKGERTSNCHFNEYAADYGKGKAEPSIEDACAGMGQMGEEELEELGDKLEDGFFPLEQAKPYRAKVRRLLAAKRGKSRDRRGAEDEQRGAGANGEGTGNGGKSGSESRDGRGAEGRRGSDAHGDGARNGKSSSQSRDGRGAEGERGAGTHGEGAGNGKSGSQARDGRGAEGRRDVGAHGEGEGNGKSGSQAQDGRGAEGRRGSGVRGDGAGDGKSGAQAGSAPGSSYREGEGKAGGAHARAGASGEDGRGGEAQKYRARMDGLGRMSLRQLTELRKQISANAGLAEDDREEFLQKVEAEIEGKTEESVRKKARDAQNKPYPAIARAIEEIEQADCREEVKQEAVAPLRSLLRQRAREEAAKLLAGMPQKLSRNQYRIFREKLSDMLGQLRAGDAADGQSEEIGKEIEDKIRSMDEEEMERICPNPMGMTFDEAAEAYEKIEAGAFLPELKTDTLEMLDKRLTKLKMDECGLLVEKLKGELQGKTKDESRLHFYEVRKVMRGNLDPEEAQIVANALNGYASARGRYEFPILICDSSARKNGNEGFVLTPDSLYYNSAFSSEKIPVRSIRKVEGNTGILSRGLYVINGGAKTKIPSGLPAKELPAVAQVLDRFVSYLKEKPESRSISYLAKEKHEVKCCYRCGYAYRGGSVCPKCGNRDNR